MPTTAWDTAWNAAEPIAACAAAPPAGGPLAGLRIVDLSLLLPGPMATRHLADLGAQVLKVEPPRGDDAASMGLPHFWQVLNHGKRRLALDLKQPSGHARLLALLRDSQGVVEGFRPGVLERLGLGWEALRALNPALVLVSISGYGSTGALAGAAGHDLNYLALAGVVDQTRSRRGEPAFSHLQIADLLGGAQTAAVGLLAGITGALLGGRGRWVQVSMTDAVRTHLVVAGCAALAGAAPGRALLDGGVACYNLYRCADGLWLAVGALELKFWQALCDAIGRPNWRTRHWSQGEAPGSSGALALVGELAALLAGAPRAHWLARCDGADCCVTPVLGLGEALFGDAPTADEKLRRLVRPAMTVRD